MDKNSNRNWSFLICLTLTLVTLAVFYQVHSFEFLNYDDQIYISENPNIHNGITLKAVKWAFTAASNIYFWHPLTWLSHILDWQLYGNNAGGHHITNLIFHILNTLLLFFVLKQMTRAIWPSAFVAALFALHPLHVESVAWIYERKDVLSTFFWFLTMWAYVRYVRGPKIAGYLLVVAFLALGLLSKPMLVTLPFVLLLLDYWPLDRLSSKSDKAGKKHSLPYLLVEKVPLFAMVAVSCIITFNNQKKIGAMSSKENLSLFVRLANTSISYMQYIIKMIWPARLAVFYPHLGPNVSIFYSLISAFLLLVITIFIVKFAQNHRHLFTGWFWYLGTLVPVIGIVQIGGWAMADHYTYIPLTGLFVIIAWGFPDLLAKWRYKKITLISSAVPAILVMSICTFFQLGYWQSNLTLFQHALDVTKNNYVAYSGVANSLVLQGKLDEAIQNYSQAVRIAPRDLIARIGLSDALLKVGKIDQAVIECQKSFQIKSDEPDVLNILGIALGQQGKLDEAVKCFTKSLQIRPDFAITHDNMGHVMILQGNYDEAVVHLTESIRLDPDYALPYYHLGQVLVQRGKINEAVTHFEKALQLKPDWAEPMNAMAWCLAVNEKTAVHNPDKAVKLARQACELTNYKEPELLDTLAIAYAATGDFDKAVETAQKALELCQSSEKEAVKEQIKSWLVLFKNKKPYIENE
jgi:tetratricopeptide (TPR) repeat protein